MNLAQSNCLSNGQNRVSLVHLHDSAVCHLLIAIGNVHSNIISEGAASDGNHLATSSSLNTVANIKAAACKCTTGDCNGNILNTSPDSVTEAAICNRGKGTTLNVQSASVAHCHTVAAQTQHVERTVLDGQNRVGSSRDAVSSRIGKGTVASDSQNTIVLDQGCGTHFKASSLIECSNTSDGMSSHVQSDGNALGNDQSIDQIDILSQRNGATCSQSCSQSDLSLADNGLGIGGFGGIGRLGITACSGNMLGNPAVLDLCSAVVLANDTVNSNSVASNGLNFQCVVTGLTVSAVSTIDGQDVACLVLDSHVTILGLVDFNDFTGNIVLALGVNVMILGCAQSNCISNAQSRVSRGIVVLRLGRLGITACSGNVFGNPAVLNLSSAVVLADDTINGNSVAGNGLDFHCIVTVLTVSTIGAVDGQDIAVTIGDLHVTISGVVNLSNLTGNIILIVGVVVTILGCAQLDCLCNSQNRVCCGVIVFGYIRSGRTTNIGAVEQNRVHDHTATAGNGSNRNGLVGGSVNSDFIPLTIITVLGQSNTCTSIDRVLGCISLVLGQMQYNRINIRRNSKGQRTNHTACTKLDETLIVGIVTAGIHLSTIRKGQSITIGCVFRTGIHCITVNPSRGRSFGERKLCQQTVLNNLIGCFVHNLCNSLLNRSLGLLYGSLSLHDGSLGFFCFCGSFSLVGYGSRGFFSVSRSFGFFHFRNHDGGFFRDHCLFAFQSGCHGGHDITECQTQSQQKR